MECTRGPKHSNEITKSFGHYLTNQYEILLRTLSFMNINDLSRAAVVCKSWNQVVNHIYRQRDKNNRFRWHTRHSQSCNVHDIYLDKGIFFRSSYVIGFELPKFRHWLWREILTPKLEMNKSSEENEDAEEFIVPGVSGGVFNIVVDVIIAPSNTRLLKHSRTGTQACAVFFPRVDGFSMKNVLVNQDDDMRSFSAELLCDRGNPLKGLLIFDRCIDRAQVLEQQLFNALIDAVPSQPFAVAGGLFQKVEKFRRDEWIGNFDTAVCAFYGENVECYADLLQSQEDRVVESFFQNMKRNLKPIDKSKQQRVAFVIRCVGREKGKREVELFFKYFPDTPAFIVLSYGEFAYRADTSKNEPKKRKKMGRAEISYAFSSVFFFITINLPS